MKLRTVLLSVAAVAALGVGPAAAQTISFGTTQTGAANNVLATALGKVVAEETGLDIRVIPETGMESTGPKIDAGRMDVMTGNATEVSWGTTGKGPWEGKPMPNLRIAAAVYAFPVAFFVKMDSDIKTVADLKGKRVGIGYSNQYSAGRHAMGILNSAGITEADVEGIPIPSVIKGADDFAQGRMDAGYFAVGAGKVKEVSAQVGGVRYLPVEDTPESVAKMREFVPAVTITTLQPRESDPAIVGPTPVMADVYYLIVGAHVADDVVVKFLDTLANQKDKLVTAAPQWGQFDPKLMYRTPEGAQWHPAAVKWFAEKGYTESQL